MAYYFSQGLKLVRLCIFITLLPFQGVDDLLFVIHPQGAATLALGYALFGLSARPCLN